MNTKEIKEYVQCPKCNAGSRRVYSDEDIEKVINGIDDVKLKSLTKYNLLRQYICGKCSYAYELSQLDILQSLNLKRQLEGKSDKEFFKEVQDKLIDSKKVGG